MQELTGICHALFYVVVQLWQVSTLLGEKRMRGLRYNDLNQPFTPYFRLNQCYISAEIQILSGLWKLPGSFVYPAISRTESFVLKIN